jgi:hypothetical protein
MIRLERNARLEIDETLELVVVTGGIQLVNADAA